MMIGASEPAGALLPVAVRAIATRVSSTAAMVCGRFCRMPGGLLGFAKRSVAVA